jgi:serine/threonine protein kinase
MRRTIGPYELVARLGSGPAGDVHLAHLSSEAIRAGAARDAVLAVRIYRPELCSAVFAEMLQSERQAALSFVHENAIRILEIAKDRDDTYLAMELGVGQPLTALLQRLALERRTLSPQLALWIAIETAEALHAAHEMTPPNGVVHGHLSPSTIWLTYEGQVRVRGVGIGRAHALVPPSHTRIAYRAPELIEGTRAWDRRADIYSLGVVAYDLLASRRAFKRRTIEDTQAAVLEHFVEPLSDASSVNAAVAELVTAMMARYRQERPKSLGELIPSLKAQLSEDPGHLSQELRAQMGGYFPEEARSLRKKIDAILRPRVDSRPSSKTPFALRATDTRPPDENAKQKSITHEIVFEPPEELTPPPPTPKPRPPSRSSVLAQLRPQPAPAPVDDALPDAPLGDALEIGQIIGEKYRVLGRLGEGGMGVVYRVEHVLMQKQLALKLLRAEISMIPQIARRFEREARAACQLDHPNIVRVTDFGREPNGTLFLVMELLHGESLLDRLATGAHLTVEEGLEIVEQVLSALDHAHRNEIIHRDLKPDNVMLVPKEGKTVVKILDFGVAKMAATPIEKDRPPLTQTGMIFGTPQYMSPEQASGEVVDGRADLYTVGVMLYQILTKRLPFDGDTTAAVLARQITQPPPPLDLHLQDRELEAALEEVLVRALAKERKDRYSSPNVFKEALQNLRGRTAASTAWTIPVRRTPPEPVLASDLVLSAPAAGERGVPTERITPADLPMSARLPKFPEKF